MTIDALRQYGANVEEGLGRCFGNETFYLKLVDMARQEPNFENLRAALDAGDLKKGFEAAHALKGVLGNLALTPLLTPVQEITELLRAGTETDYGPLMQTINAALAELKSL